jgi:hypothetical protein
MKLSDHFLRYFLIAAIILVSGIAFVIIQTALIHHDLDRFDAVELQAQAQYHKTTIMPFMANVYPKLLFLNAGVLSSFS